MKKVKSGILGFDELINGGIPEGNAILLAGPSGSGKSIFGLEFLIQGAKMGEPGVYLSFEEDEDQIKKNVETFKWGIDNEIKRNKLRVVRYDPYRFEGMVDILNSNIKQIKAKRVVIDSLSAMSIYIQDPREIRKVLVDIKNVLSENNCTAFLISESPSDNTRIVSRFGVEEFVCDGIIVLYYTRLNAEFKRSIFIWKMKASDHSNKIHPFEMTRAGIKINPKKKVVINV